MSNSGLLIIVILSLKHTAEAVESARAARKKRWICFFITLVVLAVAAIIIGVLVARAVHPQQNNS